VRELLSGVVAALAAIAALYFRRFGRRTADRFFDLFAVAFLLMALNSVLLGLSDPDSERHAALYVVRLLAFGVILGAIWLKNRPE
jgi:hypothetical protein